MNPASDRYSESDEIQAREVHLTSREIAEGRIKPSDRLPTEQALAHSLGVSRKVVREAIALLRFEGIVQPKQGVGVFVLDNLSSTLRIDREALKKIAAFRELFELRRILEVHAAGLAAERREEEALARIGAAYERMRKAEGWDAVTVDADLEFHRAVAATGNAYIASFIGFISDQVREAIATTRCRQRPGALHACDEHGRVYEAIARGDPRTAREAMERHNMEAARRLKVEL